MCCISAPLMLHLSTFISTAGTSSEHGQCWHPGLHPHESFSVPPAQQGASPWAPACPAAPGEPRPLRHHPRQCQRTLPPAGTPWWKECASAREEAALTGNLPAGHCQPSAVWAPQTAPAGGAARQWLPTRGNRRRPAHQAPHPPALSSECAGYSVPDWFLKPLSFYLPFYPTIPHPSIPCRIIPNNREKSRATKDWTNQPNSTTTLLLFMLLYVQVLCYFFLLWPSACTWPSTRSQLREPVGEIAERCCCS